MPYKDKQKQKEYARLWMAKRRANFFIDKVCTQCGSIEKLELHHLDPTQKEDHRVWSWSEQKRNVELSKCTVLCKVCHEKITKLWQFSQVTHCPRGHEYNAKNTLYNQKARRCAVCHAVREASRRKGITGSIFRKR